MHMLPRMQAKFCRPAVRIFIEDRFTSGFCFKAHQGTKSGPRLMQLNSSAPLTLAAPLVVTREIWCRSVDLADGADA